MVYLPLFSHVRARLVKVQGGIVGGGVDNEAVAVAEQLVVAVAVVVAEYELSFACIVLAVCLHALEQCQRTAC